MEHEPIEEDVNMIYPHSLISTYNCSNCNNVDCETERKDEDKPGITLSNYWCWDHSHFKGEKT